LGWPQEDRSKIVGGNAARHIEPAPIFRDWVRHGGTRFAGYLDPVQAGQYSDDTQLTLSVARACLRGPDWWTWLTTVELPQWPLYERGGGGAVLRAARAWARGRAPWLGDTQKDASAAARYFHAGGNGVAMRIAPHAILAATQPLSWEELAMRVLRDGLSTHGHPHALVGAVLHASALARALRKRDTLEYGEMLEWLIEDRAWTSPAMMMEAADTQWHEAYRRHGRDLPDHPQRGWEEVADQTLQALRLARSALDRGTLANDQGTLEAIGCFDQRRAGAGTVAALAALYVASRSASRPISGLLRTAFLHGSDTDTLASMTSSLLGAVQGTTWLGDLGHQVQDSHYLEELAWRLTRSESEPPASPPVPPVTESSLRTWTKHLHDRAVDQLPVALRCHLEDSLSLEPKSNSTITRSVLRAEDGQTLLIDKVSRPNPSPGPAKPDHGQLSVGLDRAAHGAALVNVEIRVLDLAATERFYEHALGLSVERQQGKLLLGTGVQFSQISTPSAGSPTRGLVLAITHPDPPALAAKVRSGNVQTAWSSDEKTLWLKDPDGNTIRVTGQ